MCEFDNTNKINRFEYRNSLRNSSLNVLQYYIRKTIFDFIHSKAHEISSHFDGTICSGILETIVKLERLWFGFRLKAFSFHPLTPLAPVTHSQSDMLIIEL